MILTACGGSLLFPQRRVRYQKHAAIRDAELASMEGVKAATKEGRN